MNGIIILDKPPHRTSHDMVYAIRRLTGVKKVGHTGTLDPMATGVLPICVGNATKAADMLTLSDKAYRAVMVLGKTTDTQDGEGQVLTEVDVSCTEDEIRAAVSEFVGDIEQIPPMYSAIKQNGKRLYELARSGIEVKRESRSVRINSIDIIKIEGKSVTFEVSCSKGTYIRTLCADIGERLAAGAYMASLRRIRTGGFTIGESYTLDALEEMKEKGILEKALIPTDRLFSEYPAIHLNEKQTRSVKNGVRMTWRGNEKGLCRVYDESGNFLCVSKVVEGKLVLEKSFWS